MSDRAFYILLGIVIGSTLQYVWGSFIDHIEKMAKRGTHKPDNGGGR